MQLTDLINLTANWFRPSPAIRKTDRKLLIVPVHEQVDKPQMQPVLAAAADQIAKSGLVWQWQSSNGSRHLCHWDAKQQVFLRGTLEDWMMFIAGHFKTKDTNNVEYRGPSLVVTDRLVSAVLKHPATPVADWALQLKMKREATK